MTFISIIVAALSLISLGAAAESSGKCSMPMLPPKNTRVRWGDVRATSFMARWQCAKEAIGCNLYLFPGYGFTDRYMRNYMNVSSNVMMIDSLKINTIYTIRVECVYSDECVSEFGRPGRTRTFQSRKTRTTTTTTPAPTEPTPIGACGIGYFTCETNSTECIDESFWCDRSKDCVDGTDERNCPGACTEITSFHYGGNYSCSRWNSRRSACFFQCNGDFVRDGPWYTMCKHDKWTRAIPTCRLARLNVTVIGNGLSANEIAVSFPALTQAETYSVLSVIDVVSDIAVAPRFRFDIVENVVQGTIYQLEPGKLYSITIAGVDDNGVEGFASRAARARTAPDGGKGKE